MLKGRGEIFVRQMIQLDRSVTLGWQGAQSRHGLEQIPCSVSPTVHWHEPCTSSCPCWAHWFWMPERERQGGKMPRRWQRFGPLKENMLNSFHRRFWLKIGLCSSQQARTQLQRCGAFRDNPGSVCTLRQGCSYCMRSRAQADLVDLNMQQWPPQFSFSHPTVTSTAKIQEGLVWICVRDEHPPIQASWLSTKITKELLTVSIPQCLHWQAIFE